MVDRTFTDKASGKDTERPQLPALEAYVRDGDTVVVHSMDRNLDDLRKLVQTLTQRGGRIEFVKEQLTFTGQDSPMATLLLSVMGAFAEFERSLIRDRQRDGVALAKQRGAYRGRQKRWGPKTLPSSINGRPPENRRHGWPSDSGLAVRPLMNICRGLRRLALEAPHDTI